MNQVLITGITNGSIYGIVAMSYAIVFYVTRVVNFATGQVMMAAIMVTTALSMKNLPISLSIIIGISTSIILSLIIYFIGVRPVQRLDRFSFAWLVSTIGIGIVIESIAAVIWGVGSEPFPQLLNGKTFAFLGGRLTAQQAMCFLVAIFIVAAYEVLRRKTLFGKLGMAISSDPEIASTIGGNVKGYAILAFAISGLLLGVAGVLVGPTSFADAYLGGTFGISGFVALMIGGIESPVGAMFGGFTLGILESFAVTYINAQSASWFPFVTVLLVLLLAPDGIFTSGKAIKKNFRKILSNTKVAA